MNQFADWFAPSLLRTSLSLIVAALLVATCIKWLRLRSPGGEQWAWLLVLSQGVMFVWLTVPVPEELLPVLRKAAAPIQELVPARLPEVQAVPISDPPPKNDVPEQAPARPRRPIEEWVEPKAEIAIASAPPVTTPVSLRDRLPNWSIAAIGLWLAGLIAVIAVGAARYAGFARRLRTARPAPADWSHEWQQLCAAAGLDRPIPLVIAKNLGPALCRLPSGYLLVVPETSWALLTNDQRAAIFRHELEHYRRGDVWRLLFVRLLASVHWFNPCAWWAAHRYEAQSEFACDAAAAGDDPAAFSELLVQLAAGSSRRITGVQAVAAGSVYERVQRLLGESHPHGGWRTAFPALLAAAAIVAVGVRVEAVSNSTDSSTALPFVEGASSGDDSVSVAEKSDEVDKLHTLVDPALRSIDGRRLQAGVHSPWQIMSGLMGLGPSGQLHNGDQSQPDITFAEYARGAIRFRDKPLWEMTETGPQAYRLRKPFVFESHPNQFLWCLAAADLPVDTALVAYDSVGKSHQVTIRDLVENAKRQASEQMQEPLIEGEVATYTLLALSHYLPTDTQWFDGVGHSWSIERLAELQLQRRVETEPNWGATRRLALALAVRKHRAERALSDDTPLTAVWEQAERELTAAAKTPAFDSAELEAIVGEANNSHGDFQTHAQSIHNLRWQVAYLPSSELRNPQVIKQVEALARLVFAHQRDGVEPGLLYTGAHALRIYRERLAVAAPATSRDGAAADRLAETLLAAADAKPAATETQAADPPQDVAADELAGVVVDAEGRPIPDVLIDVWSWHPGNETRTDAQGLFRLKGLEQDRKAELLIGKEGYTPQHFAQQQVGARGWKIVLNDKTYLEGTITGSDGQPAVGAEIRAAFGPVQADGVQIGEVTTIGKAGLDGKYRLYLKPDKYDIQIVAPGQGVKRLTEVVLDDGVAKPLSVTLERGVRFEAHVVDSESGKPVEGFILWQWRAPFLFGRSNADGKITFDDLVPGATDFNCGGGEPKQYGAVKYYQHGPFGRWWSAQAMQEWERKQIDDPKTGWQRNFDNLSFDLQLGMPPVEIVVEQGVKVSGYVTDPDGNPVAGATVAPAKTGSGNSLTGDTRYSVKSGADGKFDVVLPASNAAQYNLTVHDGEYQEWRKWANGVTPPMQTKPGQVIEGFELQLTNPATVRGHVTFGGKSAAGREVRAHSFDKLENRYYDPTTKTDKDGNFELKFVRPGKHYLQVEPFWLAAEDARHGSRVIEVAPGQELEGQDLVAGRLDSEPVQSLAAVKFQARVVDQDGKPVPGASVGLGSFAGTPYYLKSWLAHVASLGDAAADEKSPVTGDDGLIDLQYTQYLVQSRQSTALIYAVDAPGGRAGTVLFNLEDYATVDPNAGPQIVEVPIAALTPTRITLNAAALDAAHLDASNRLMLLEIQKDGLPLQRILAAGEPIEMLLPPGEYSVGSNQWFAERIQTTFQVAATAAPPPVEIELKLSRLGSLVGQPAPEFAELKALDSGANPTLAQLKGKVVVLDFWGHWCGPCVQSMPNLMTLHDEYKDRGVEFIAVHDDSVESWSKLQPILDKLAKERWNGRAIPFPVVLDGGGETPIPGSELSVNGATTASYGIWSWPTTLVIDREGRVNGLIVPHDLDSARKQLKALLDAQ